MDKQLGMLSRIHMEAKHVKINAEKVPCVSFGPGLLEVVGWLRK
jgi:hypothetical protein